MYYEHVKLSPDMISSSSRSSSGQSVGLMRSMKYSRADVGDATVDRSYRLL